MDNKIRTLCWYQPFAFLMLHGKIETRLVKKGKKPPFPLGTYVGYAAKKSLSIEESLAIMGEENYERMDRLSSLDTWACNTGNALFMGDLVEIRKMQPEDEAATFVKYEEHPTHDRWCLIFQNIKRLMPFEIKGKQGVGFLTEEEKQKLVIV